ncbi:MAG TPA: energy transducer TonB [Allosphingosinicella sp.]|jgi:TonB family protein
MILLSSVPFMLGAAQVATPPVRPPHVIPAPVPQPPPPGPPILAPSEPPAVRARPIGADLWITTDDYPVAALRAEAEGEVFVEYRIGADGRVRDCAILRSSGVPSLDLTTCTLITRRARFTPARDKNGRAVPDARVQRVVWTLPADMSVVAFVPGYVVAAVPVYSQSRDACALAHSRKELELLSERLCAALPAVLSPGAPTSELPLTLAVMTLTGPDGRLPRRPRTQGTLRYREEATFEVASDGTIANCSSRVARSWRRGARFDLCRFLAAPGGPLFAAEPEGTAPRRGRISVELYATEGYVEVGTI